MVSKFGMGFTKDPFISPLDISIPFFADVPELAKLQECIKSTLQIAEQWKLVERDESDPDDN